MEELLHHSPDRTRLPELSFLRTPELNESLRFRQLRSELERLYQPSGTQNTREGVLYTSLLACLREAAFTPDREEREAALERIQTWLNRKRGRISVVRQGKREGDDGNSWRRTSFLRRSEVISGLESRSLSPYTRGKSQVPSAGSQIPVDLFPVTPPPVMDDGKLLERWQEHQQQQSREARSRYISRAKPTQAINDLTTDESFFLTTGGETPLITQPTEMTDGGGKAVSPPPLLVDLRRDFLSSSKPGVGGTIEGIEERLKHKDHTQRRSTASSLSHYTPVHIQRPRTPSHSVISSKPNSKPIQPSSLSPIRRAVLTEIDDIKRKLVQKAAPCTYRTLQLALLEPEMLPVSQLTPQNLPVGGELLMSNPFLTLGRRKKKKMKRKKG